MTGACGHAPMNTCHDGPSLTCVRQKVALDDAGIGIAGDPAAARRADHVLGALTHTVPLVGRVYTNLAAGRQAEPFLGSGLGLQLGHFSSFQ